MYDQMPDRSVTPSLPVGAFETFQVSSPLATHWRKATCAEVECGSYVNGFSLTVDPRTDLGAAQLAYVGQDAGRPKPAREALPDGRLRLTYPPGTQPFAGGEHDNHVLPLGREEFFVRWPGDHRGRLGERKHYDRADQWVDDFAGNLDRLRAALERG